MRLTYYARRIVPRRLQRPLRNSLAVVRAPLLRGNARECPICRGSFRRFLNAPGRPDVVCPRCYSGERHRLLWIHLRDQTEFFRAPQRVLHFAAENCFESRMRRLRNLDYLTADLEAPADARVDLTDVSFPDESFDVVLCLHVLEHIEDDRVAMRELRRILRPGGFAVVDVPLGESDETFEPDTRDPRERFRLLGQHDHVRFYGREDLRLRLQAAGFDVSVERLAAELSPSQRERLGFHGDETLHICRPRIASVRSPVAAAGVADSPHARERRATRSAPGSEVGRRSQARPAHL
jgi:SAM-dependent methyltransferase